MLSVKPSTVLQELSFHRYYKYFCTIILSKKINEKTFHLIILSFLYEKDFATILFVFINCRYCAEKEKVIFFGDSITQAAVDKGGYIVRMDSMLEKRV